jgi:hypothetical protein
MDSSLAVIPAAHAAQEEQERPKRGKIVPPLAVNNAGRRKQNAKSSSKNHDNSIITRSGAMNSGENVGIASHGTLKMRLSSKLLDFDMEVERRHKEIQAEGDSASRALEQVKHIWKMQLPPLVKATTLAELNGTYKGDISAALQKARDDKVLPQMTPLVRRSVRKNLTTASRIAMASKPLSTPRTASKHMLGSISSASMDVDASSSQMIDVSNLDVLSSSMLTQFMSKSASSDLEKSAALEALKKQIAIIEKAIPSKKK